MKKYLIALAVVVLLIIIAGAVYLKSSNPLVTVPNPLACTEEAKLCPDGVTYVARQGPNCEFAECPVAQVIDETADWKTYKNDEYGFEFQYPAGLALASPTSTSRFLFRIDSWTNQKVNKDKLSIGIGLFVLPLNSSGTEMLKEVKDTWSGQTSDLQEIKIGENPAIKVSYVIETVSDVDGTVNRTASVVLETFENKNSYSFQCSQEGNNLDRCDRIISTFKFTK